MSIYDYLVNRRTEHLRSTVCSSLANILDYLINIRLLIPIYLHGHAKHSHTLSIILKNCNLIPIYLFIRKALLKYCLRMSPAQPRLSKK